jgi:hypothetical protein
MTTISGTAVTAAWMTPDPLDGALVYIPKIPAGTKLPPLTDGPRCRTCVPLPGENILSAAVTCPDGRFTLYNVPAGTGIPLVFQLGSWRRQTTIDVVPCVDNVLPAGTARLPPTAGTFPDSHRHSEHGGIECCSVSSVAAPEFANPAVPAHSCLSLHRRAIIGANRAADVFGGRERGDWSWAPEFSPCGGAEMVGVPEVGNFSAYVNGGGRVLATHFSYSWLFHNGSFGSVGSWTPGGPDPSDPLATDVVVSSFAGLEFASWLSIAGALSRSSPPQMQLSAPHADLGALAPGADLWLSSFSPPTTQLATIDVPMLSPPDKICGRIAFSDFHGSSMASPGATFPSECDTGTALSPQEKALEFMLFNLVACVGPKTTTPQPGPSPPRGPPPPAPPPPPNYWCRRCELAPLRGPLTSRNHAA